MRASIGKFIKHGGRKIDITVDEFDTWNCDNTLAHLIYPMLCQLRDTNNSVPNEFSDVGGESYEYQASFDFYQESYNEAFSNGIDRWQEVLDKMIWSFEQLVHENYSDKYQHGSPKVEFEKTDKIYPNSITGKTEPTYVMVDRDSIENWTDYNGITLAEERIQEGIDLFAKYYRSLWN